MILLFAKIKARELHYHANLKWSVWEIQLLPLSPDCWEGRITA
jgi:hypothetical protein